MPFRLQGKYWFLTYARADFDIDGYEHWLRLILQNKYVGSVICRESHQDGAQHRHVAFEVSERIDIRTNRYFDYQEFHPNIQTARSWKAVLRYVTKTEDWKGYAKYEHLEDEPETAADNYEGTSTDIVDVARRTETEEHFLIWCIAKNISYGYANRIWTLVQQVRPQLMRDNDTVDGSLRMPYLSFLQFDLSTRRALVLQGPSGVGKTTWALRNAPRPALVVTHMDDLQHMRPDVKTIIFDDMDFKHLPRTSQIHLVDFDLARSIHCRYRCARIPAGIYKIFTCNEYPFNEDAAINRRVNHIDLSEIPVD